MCNALCNHMQKAYLLGRGGAFESKYFRCKLTLYDLLSLAGCSYKKSEHSTMYIVQCKVYTYLTIVQLYICKSCVGEEQCYKQSEGGIGNDPELASTWRSTYAQHKV